MSPDIRSVIIFLGRQGHGESIVNWQDRIRIRRSLGLATVITELVSPMSFIVDRWEFSGPTRNFVICAGIAAMILIFEKASVRPVAPRSARIHPGLSKRALSLEQHRDSG
jgi:hypothetical protein